MNPSTRCRPAPARSSEDNRSIIEQTLLRTRERTVLLTDAVDEQDLIRQHSPLMSPLVWDLAHIGNQEELWLVRDVGGRAPVRQDIDELYDAFKHPRVDRPSLPLLSPVQARGYVGEVRDKVWDVLAAAALDGRGLGRASGGPHRSWVTEAFMFGLIVQHEQQHDETMLATHQLRAGGPVLQAPSPPTPAAGVRAQEVRIPAGRFSMGTSSDPWALDNERPGHAVHVAGFAMDRYPVTNADYARFVAAGGYRQPRWWSVGGWRHRRSADLAAPQFWTADGDWWLRRVFGTTTPLVPDEPVVHVSFYEAEAYAAWSGKRLPTEWEWEKAARYDPLSGSARRNPWGEHDATPAQANLGQRHLRPARIGAYPAGASALGVEQLLGDVWEWTSSDFHGYPGFTVMPYADYSAPFFGGDYKVLRGGSFGTDSAAVSGTFRNWDHPIRRQIFAGFRCARDLRPEEA
ncbi:MAG: ergothioneine biosynthesis protein EgtB [Sciscionella sp.]